MNNYTVECIVNEEVVETYMVLYCESDLKAIEETMDALSKRGIDYSEMEFKVYED